MKTADFSKAQIKDPTKGEIVGLLSNGLWWNAPCEIGEVVMTQWGPRTVVAVKWVEWDDTPDMPYGC